MVSKKKRQKTETLAETFARLLPCPEAVSLPVPRFSNVGPQGPFDLSALHDAAEAPASPHWSDPVLHDLRVFLEKRPGSAGDEVWAIVSCDQPADRGLAVSLALLADNDRWQRRTVPLNFRHESGSRGQVCFGTVNDLREELETECVTIDVFLLQPADRPTGSAQTPAVFLSQKPAATSQASQTGGAEEDRTAILKQLQSEDVAAASLALSELIHRTNESLFQKLMRATDPRDRVYIRDALEAAWVVVWRLGRRGQLGSNLSSHLLTIAGEQLCNVIKYRSAVPLPPALMGRGEPTERNRTASEQAAGAAEPSAGTADAGAGERIANLRRQLPPLSEQDQATLDQMNEGMTWGHVSPRPPR
jgi:hypothetical protein